METHGFYGRSRQISQSPKSDSQNKLDILVDAVQANADAIKGVVQNIQLMSKEIDELKRKNAPSPATTPRLVTSRSVSKRIPSELSMSCGLTFHMLMHTSVKCIYASLTDQQQFKVDERYRSSHNQQVTAWLLDQLKKSSKLEQYSEFHTRAVYRYYESRRRQFMDSHQSREKAVAVNQKNSTKRRSQKNLYLKRQAVLKDAHERSKWAEIDASYMTDESDCENDFKRVKVTHKPAWRSNWLNRLIGKLDRRLAAKKETVEYSGFKEKERVAGLVSLSEAPKNAPAWAVDPSDAVGTNSTPPPTVASTSELKSTPTQRNPIKPRHMRYPQSRETTETAVFSKSTKPRACLPDVSSSDELNSPAARPSAPLHHSSEDESESL